MLFRSTSGTERSRSLPSVPTFGELGLPRLVQNEWFGAFMPARTSPAVVTAASEAVRRALSEGDVRDTWQRVALSVHTATPAELQRTLRTEHDFWGPIIRGSGFTPEA